MNITHETMKELVKELKPKKILDLGSGNGLCSSEIRTDNPEARFLLVDKNETILKMAQEKGFEVYKSAIEKFETKQKYDLIILSAILEHLEKPEKALQKAHRFLKKDGHIVVNVPSKPEIVGDQIAWIYRRARHGIQKTKIIEQEHKQLKTSKEWTEMIQRNGFKIEKIMCGSVKGKTKEKQGMKERILRNSINILAKKEAKKNG